MVLIVDQRSELARVRRHEKMFELARISLAWFVRYRFEAEGRPLLWNWHLDLVCEHLEAVTNRQLLRLLINVPPRSLKTEIVAESWPAWMIGRDNSPRSSVVSSSYSTSLAARASFRTLAMMHRPWYQHLFPGIEWVKKTAVEWETATGCSRVAAGSGGTITGKGGDHLVGDDLLKPQDANSEIEREKVNDWLGETFHSRLNDPKTGTKTIIGQRLHERDVFGYLLEQMQNQEAEQWTHLCLPCENIDHRPKVYAFGGFRYIRRANELLHPARFGPQQVAHAKTAMRVNYEGQYNQRPQKMAGGRLQPSRLVRVEKTPQQMITDWGLVPHIWIDLATKEKESGKDNPDFSVIQVWAKDQLHRRILLHVWREQCPVNRMAEAIIDVRKTYCQTGIVRGEKIGLQHAFRPMMMAICQLRKLPMVPILDCAMSATTDPQAKVAPFEGVLNAGIVVVPKDATWLPDFEAEMRSWPKGAKDDQMVTAGYANHDLDVHVAGEVPPSHPEVPPDMITGEMLAQARATTRKLKGEELKPGAWSIS